MGGRGASSSSNSYSKVSYKNWDTLMNERNEMVKKERARTIELVSQGIPLVEAVDKANREFEKEYDKIDERFRQRSLEINNRRRNRR